MARGLRSPTLVCVVLISAALVVCCGRWAAGNTTLFFEDFNSLPLQPSISYVPTVPNAFTHTPPAGWTRGTIDEPIGGRPEWRGWSFARKSFWDSVGGGRRTEFQFGQGTIAVADPDEWNEIGNPANLTGFYNTALSTPFISLASPDTGARKLAFDSSWLGECCDDGEMFDPNGNNQTAIIRLRFPNGSFKEILHWESAPFLHNGSPSINPADTPNPFFKSPATNERVLIDLSPFLSGVSFTQARLEFSLINAGDDGWWAFDTMRMFSLSLVPGDMNIDGTVDGDDIPAFALGVQNVDGYRDTYFGEFPVTRGSPDAVFDFDDIPWFVGLLESGGLASAAADVQAALAGLSAPEPSSAWLIAIGIATASPIRRFRRAVVAVC